MTSEVVHFLVGDFPCLVLADSGVTDNVTDTMISSIFAKDAERMLTAFRALPAPLGFGMNILLLDTPGKRVLIDTGNGLSNPADPGHLLANLRAEHIMPESIDTVIITHYHMDHIGGLLDGDGKPAFARARLVVPKQEHEHWMREEVLAQIDPQRAARFRQILAVYTSRLTLMDDAIDIEPGIQYAPAPGHTPGHRTVSIESQGARLLHLADTLHVPLQLNAVDVAPSIDALPDLAISTRRDAIERAEAEKLLVMLYHFPFPGLGHIQRTGDLRTWVPYQIPESLNT